MRSAKHLASWSRRFRRPWQRRLARVGLALLSVVALGWVGWAAAGVYVDWSWFGSLGYSDVYARQLSTRLILFLAGGAIIGLLYLSSLRLAQRLHEASTTAEAADEGLWAYLARVSAGLSGNETQLRRASRAFVGMGVALAGLFGLAAAGSWERWLLAMNAVPFGLAEPLFGREVGFYIFTLPLLRALHGWALGALAAVTLATLGAYLSRSWLGLGLPPIRALAELGRPARVHLACLGATLFGLLALHHQLALAEVVLATSGQAFRLSFPGYVEANARVPALWVMSLASIGAGVLLVWVGLRSGRSAVGLSPERWTLRSPLGLGLAIWLGVQLLGALYPTAVQALVVRPNEAVLERPYLGWVNQMTRAAYGLDGLAERTIPAEEPPRPDLVPGYLSTLANLRLWEPEQLRLGLSQLQTFKPYYSFFLYPDIDRYSMGGQTRAVLVAARELDPQALPARSWVNTRLQFTHGYGVVAALAGAVGPDGRPVLVERDLPPQGELGLARPEIYFGERTTEPALVRTTEAEIDYPRGDENVPTRYQGRGGVSLSGPLARLAHAVRLADLNLLLSPAIGPEAALLHGRQVAERVRRLAPFLLLDADPYPVVVDGRLIWMLDGYTTSDHFPLAPRAPARLLDADPQPGRTRNVAPNYLRGAVKATVDAFDGSVSLYVADPRDPLVAAYQRIYPGLIQPLEALPPGLRAHLRYPQQLFSVQADVLARFHTLDPGQLYSGEDAWLAARGRFDTRPDARPLYGVQRLPGEASEELTLTLPYRPYSQANDRHNLVALLAARSDPGHYGELVMYRYPKDRPVEGPFQAELRVDQDPTVSAQFGLWQRSGAQLIRGEIQTVPLGNSVLYLQSIFLQRLERTGLPELQRVVAVSGGKVVMEPGLEAALSSLYGTPVALNGADSGASDRPRAGGTAEGARPGATARELALSTQEHLQRAQEALYAGDRPRHERELQAAQSDLQRLTEATR